MIFVIFLYDWIKRVTYVKDKNICTAPLLKRCLFQDKPPKAKYEIEAENRELSRVLEKKSQEIENLTGNLTVYSAARD